MVSSYHATPKWKQFLLNWIGYLLLLPIRSLLFALKLTVAPVVFPTFYLLHRELVHYPSMRHLLQRVKEDGVEITGRTRPGRVTFDSSQETVQRLLQSLEASNKSEERVVDTSKTYCFEYEFCNGKEEVNRLLDKDYDDLSITQEVPLIVISFESNTDPVQSCLEYFLFENRPISLEIWTDQVYEHMRQATPPFVWRRFCLSMLTAAIAWNLASLLFFIIPVYVGYGYFKELGPNEQRREFWDYYQSVPWYASLFFIPVFWSDWCFKPHFWGRESVFVVQAVPESEVENRFRQ